MTTRPIKSTVKIDNIINNAVFSTDSLQRETSRRAIREEASARGIFLASIQNFYNAAGDGRLSGVSVPAINIRGMTYHVARAVFRAAIKGNVGAFIFEIARSEIGYTKQRPYEYATCILAAAIRENFKGPVFVQGDHFQVNRAKYATEPETELKAIKELTQEAVVAGFYNIDIDSSTTVNLDKLSHNEQQENNSRITAEMTKFIRSIEPAGITISVGGEIGEIGRGNSTVEDLRAFMTEYRRYVPSGIQGISKVSVQTGTVHGGVVLPNGSIAEVNLDFETLEKLSRVAREEFGLGGAVQHGASTLPEEAFDKFPQTGTLEVHLATGFQNMIYDSPYFPEDLLKEIYAHILSKYADDKKQGETDQQFIYKTRKKTFGDFKEEIWSLPKENLNGIRKTLEDRFYFIFQNLNAIDTKNTVNKLIENPSPPV
jgi:fructose/tagatose bisphosphate aldolase